MGKKHFTSEKREILARLLNDKISQRQIARILDMSPSAISQELSRNRLADGTYSPEAAQMKAYIRRLRANRNRHSFPDELIEYIKEKLECYWSPEQISERLRIDFPNSKKMRISFKTIYNKVCPKKKAPRTELVDFRKYLRRKHIVAKSFKKGRPKAAQDVSNVLRSIEERPASVNAKTSFGHWESDLISGKRGSGYMVTFVERMTGHTLAWVCLQKTKEAVNAILRRFMETIPAAYRKTITVDRGTEFYGYAEIEKESSTKFYFCHPRCPHERGLNENTNGLLRQFFPKKTDFSKITPAELTRALKLLANRPKKKFAYRTTIETLQLQGLGHLVKF